VNPLKKIYMIGDNPDSDIKGANKAGAHWSSILVQTGIYDTAQELEHHPHVHAPTVKEAIQHIYEENGLPPVL
jgi:ribonucleotide monophosphatase NagD (HAD superfamily)